MAVRFFQDALVRARAHPVAFVAALSATVVLAVVAVCGALYIVTSVPPYGFYYDLGVDLLATSTIAHWVQGWSDVKDAFGWAGWGDRSAFAFAPMTATAISVTLAKIFGGDAFEAVKGVQALQVFLAALSSLVLYRVLRGNTMWALVAASVYALLAEQLLMIRGDLAFGFTAALAPLAFAIPLMLVRSYGLLALPICAALVSLITAYFTIEHLFLQAVPAYGFAMALAFDRRRAGAWLLASSGGLAILFATVAYVVLPTQASMSLFTPSATVGAALASGEFAEYANGALALASLCMNELIANPRKEFAPGPVLFLMLPVGLVLWALAIAWIVGAIRHKRFSWGEIPLALTGLICILLSSGAFIPGGGIVWWIISQLPVLDNIRTPDRFMALGVVAIAIFAVSQLEEISHRKAAGYYAAGLAVLLCGCGLAIFFLLRIFLGDVVAVEGKEPYLSSIAGVAQQRDNRVANLASVNKGSVFDTSLYGAPLPFLDFQGDFAQRYEGDGLGGSGMLARGNVATIVATPPWTPDSPLLGQSSLVRAGFLKTLAGDATTAAAYGVEPVRGYVRGVREACLSGGPGLLDNVVAVPAFASTAVTLATARCSRNLYLDSSPLEVELGGSVAYRWSSLALFPRSGIMRDVDYRLALGRFLINVPWYRNSVDGDAPVFGDAAASLDAGDQSSSVFEIDRAGTYSFVEHVVCHAEIHGRVLIDQHPRSFACKPLPGFQWLNVPIGTLRPGLHGMSLVFDTVAEAAAALPTTWRLAFDGAAIVRNGHVTLPSSQNAFVFSAGRLLVPDASAPPPGALSLTAFKGMQLVGPARPDGAQRLLARTPNAVATYRWSGPPGRYRIWATAYAESGYEASSWVGIYTGNTCCIGVATGVADRGGLLIAHADVTLRTDGLVHVLVRGASNDILSITQLLGVTIEPEPLRARPTGDRSLVAADFDFLDRFKHLAPELPAFGASPEPGHNEITRFTGLPVSSGLLLHVLFPSGAQASPTTLSISGDFGSGPLRVQLVCGNVSVEGSFLTPVNTLALPPDAADICTIRLASVWSTAYVADVTVSRSVGAYDLGGRRWLSAGRYHVVRVRRGAVPGGGSVTVDGRNAHDVIALSRDAWHALRWKSAPADAEILAFVPVSWPRQSLAPIVKQTASARWTVALGRTATVEAAVFPDGYWRLSGNGRSLSGHRCDLENTCFANVPPGTYLLLHLWPGYIKLGFAITLLAWLVVAIAWVRARRSIVR